MHIFRKYSFNIIFCLLSIILVLSILYWLKSSPSSDIVNSQPHSVPPSFNTTGDHNDLDPGTQKVFASQSQRDTEINCQLNVEGHHKLIVDERTQQCFEYFISQYGEKNIAQIKADFQTFIIQSYAQPIAGEILDLWSRYLNYREQLAGLKTPTLNPESVQYLKTVFQSMQSLRQQFFSKVEIEGLFGQEDIYHQYTLQRQIILENQALSEAEKAKQLNALFQQLPQDWQQDLEQLNMLENLRRLTAEIKARQGSATELRQMRLNLVGTEATQRLERLDGERQNWRTQVTQYLQQRDEILLSGLNDIAKQQAIQHLKDQHFDSPQQQLRLQTFEQQHDRGGQLPFADSL